MIKKEKPRMRNITIKSPKYQNKEWLKLQYFDLRRKIKDIAKENNINVKTVHYWLRKFGYRKRGLHVGNYNKHPINEENQNWKGDDVGYFCLHNWVRRRKSQPKHCQNCGKEKEYLELANLSGEYKRDVNDYVYLCVRCHKEFDGTLEPFIEGGRKTRFKKGHKNDLRWKK